MTPDPPPPPPPDLRLADCKPPPPPDLSKATRIVCPHCLAGRLNRMANPDCPYCQGSGFTFEVL